MDPSHSELLTKYLVELVKDMDTLPIVDFLLSSSTFEDHHEDEIRVRDFVTVQISNDQFVFFSGQTDQSRKE